MLFNILFSVIFSVSSSSGSNILAFIPTPSYSHQIAFTSIWRELSLRGHKVTVLTPNPLKDSMLVNLTEIDISSIYSLPYVKNFGSIIINNITMWNFYKRFLYMTRNTSIIHLSSQTKLQVLLRNTNKFDVVLTEFSYPEYFAFAEMYKCPKILVSSLDGTVFYYGVMENPAHPVLNPEIMLPYIRPETFIERITSTVFSWYVRYVFLYDISLRQEILDKYFNISVTMEELIKDIDLFLVNSNPAIQIARPLRPTTIDIGGPSRKTFSKHISKDLKEFLDSAKEGFIYFSLGSNVKSKELNKDTFNAIKQTLSEVPYKVLWKFEDDNLPGKPDNVKLVKWAPQQNVLSHPNIKLFVTQGGLQSMEEAIYSEVPCVVIPFFADQEQNAKLMETRGIAKIVGRTPSVDKTELKSAILEVVNNPKYKNAVVRLKQLALDTPMTGLDKAIWWIEYVIRNNGTKHLRNPAADIPTYQYYLLDVIGFLLASIGLALYLAFVVIKTVINLVRKRLLPKFLLEKKKLQ